MKLREWSHPHRICARCGLTKSQAAKQACIGRRLTRYIYGDSHIWNYADSDALVAIPGRGASDVHD